MTAPTNTPLVVHLLKPSDRQGVHPYVASEIEEPPRPTRVGVVRECPCEVCGMCVCDDDLGLGVEDDFGLCHASLLEWPDAGSAVSLSPRRIGADPSAADAAAVVALRAAAG